MSNLTGKTAVVTGASRGIGEATVRALAVQGARVLLAARTEKDIARIATEIIDQGGAAAAITCDVSKNADVVAMIDRAQSEFGPVDILINNAGVIEPIKSLASSDPDSWGQVIDVNVKGVYYGMRAVMPAMIARGSGTILTIGSGAAHGPLEGWSHYCASKAAALMLNASGHKEAGAAGINFINLSPGTVATQMQVDIKASGINPVSQLDPSVHIPPAWVGEAIAWLCGPDGAEFAGTEVSLRDETLRARIGLSA